jgi:hypothetical protein
MSEQDILLLIASAIVLVIIINLKAFIRGLLNLIGFGIGLCILVGTLALIVTGRHSLSVNVLIVIAGLCLLGLVSKLFGIGTKDERSTGKQTDDRQRPQGKPKPSRCPKCWQMPGYEMCSVCSGKGYTIYDRGDGDPMGGRLGCIPCFGNGHYGKCKQPGCNRGYIEHYL